ncbi:DUF982 domain-containing protein [Phyllobacterium sp. 22552]|uniref:DUF982 domain-containing protein n=1 Tax=Phyllobacterium sp. 22552 TaxID=3453941 RepID=UPI003F86C6C0
MTRQLGMMKVITSIMQAAEFIVNEWPGTDTERLDIAKHALLECYDGKLSPGVARMAFIEAAKEADIYIEAIGRPPSTGKVDKWRNGKMRRRA